MSQLTYSLHNRKVVCNVVLAGSYLLVTAMAFLLLLSLSLHGTRAVGPLIVCALGFVYLGMTQALSRLRHHFGAACLLVVFYALIATGIIWTWGVDNPIGLLIFTLVIVLAGILLTAYSALYAALVATAVLFSIQTAVALGWHMPDMSWSGKMSSYGDVLGYGVVFGMLALISWLYNREMERSLHQAYQAEVALSEQKATLKLQVEQRTAELRKVQLQEMQQMYRFSELGQLGITLLHDLANHLTALTLEIEELQSKRHAKSVSRAREIIGYLEDIVESTRDRLHGNTKKQTFDIIRQTTEALSSLEYKAAKNNVKIAWQPSAGPWRCHGDPLNYCQIVAILTSNAIDAYGPPESERKSQGASAADKVQRLVAVTAQKDAEVAVIRISDWGAGIPKSKRRHLFKPHHSSKKSGLGLGLYIAKQTVEMHFSGTLTIDPQSANTEFIITLPLNQTHDDSRSIG